MACHGRGCSQTPAPRAWVRAFPLSLLRGPGRVLSRCPCSVGLGVLSRCPLLLQTMVPESCLLLAPSMGGAEEQVMPDCERRHWLLLVAGAVTDFKRQPLPAWPQRCGGSHVSHLHLGGGAQVAVSLLVWL